jgi:hypothetical protein
MLEIKAALNFEAVFFSKKSWIFDVDIAKSAAIVILSKKGAYRRYIQ